MAIIMLPLPLGPLGRQLLQALQNRVLEKALGVLHRAVLEDALLDQAADDLINDAVELCLPTRRLTSLPPLALGLRLGPPLARLTGSSNPLPPERS